MDTRELLQLFLGAIHHEAGAKTVFGEPVAAEGRTIIPVAKVGYGWGAGYRPGENDPAKADADKKLGFGGGVGAKPIGVIELSNQGTKFIPLGLEKKLLGAAVVGFLLGLLYGKWRGR
jgi:uncharacterized spore protein YtfJ